MQGDSLDGFYLTSARTLGPNTIEVYGWAIIISTQDTTPFFACLTLNQQRSALVAYRVMLGVTGTGRFGIGGLRHKGHLIDTLNAPIDSIPWKYRASYGEN